MRLGHGIHITDDRGVSLINKLKAYGNLTFAKNYAAATLGEATAAILAADYSVGSPTATITASRGASNPATYIDNNGVIRLVTTSNVGRRTSGFYDSTGFVSRPGLIVEGASTNLIVRADGTLYDATKWTTGWSFTEPAGGTTTKSVVLVPTLTSITSSASQRFQYTGQAGDTNSTLTLAQTSGAATVAQNDWLTISGWIRSQTGFSGIGIKFTISARTAADAALTAYTSSDFAGSVTSSWKRFSYSVQITDATVDKVASRFQVTSIDTNDTVDVEFWGVQTEKLPFASTFIPTTTAALTRNAETLTYPIASNRTAATESNFVKFTSFAAGTAYASSAFIMDTITKERLLAISSTTDKLKTRPNATDYVGVEADASTSVTAFQSYVVADTLRQTPNPQATIYVDGVSVGTSSTNTWDGTIAWGSTFCLGSNNGSTAALYGIIQSLAIFSDAKNAANVLAISNLMAGA